MLISLYDPSKWTFHQQSEFCHVTEWNETERVALWGDPLAGHPCEHEQHADYHDEQSRGQSEGQ